MSDMFDDNLYEDDENGLFNKYLVFNLESEKYGIIIDNVNEIIEIRKLVKVPTFPNYVLGIIDLRDRIFPVIDLKIKMGLKDSNNNNRKVIITLLLNSKINGIVVDSIQDIINIKTEEINNSIINDLEIDSLYVEGITKLEDDIITILSMENLIG